MSWYNEYTRSLKLRQVEELFDLFVYRPLAFLLVKAVYRTPVTPNQLTVMSILMGFIAAGLFAAGQTVTFVAGAIFYILSVTLDCADGQLARLKKNGTPLGRIIDGVADTTVYIAVMVGAGIGYANQQENPLLWWGLFTLTGFSTLVHSILVDFYRNRYLDYHQGRSNNYDDGLREFKEAYRKACEQQGKGFEKAILSLYLKYMALQQRLVARKLEDKPLKYNREEYLKKNHFILQLWLVIGPTTQITTIVVFSFFQRFDLLVWVVAAGYNALALLLWIAQQFIDRTHKTQNR